MAFFEVCVTVERLAPRDDTERTETDAEYWFEVEASDGEHAERYGLECYRDRHCWVADDQVTAHARRLYA